ncbi:unnamed protein product [Cuscuta campestris]|uniref:protein-serine/threonine phosphatase n=1 Tax=Cuscuta campestris TaxID=132261 RepID=A0A484KCW5_9ASTE|nr:unnamed protein product [Cuscuta campestris]
MEEMYPAVVVPFSLGSFVCDSQIHMDVTNLNAISDSKSDHSVVVSSIARESEDDDLNLDTSSCSLSIASDTSSACNDDLLAELARADGSHSKPPVLDKGSSGGTVTRSVFEVDYVPLWGYVSVCGRRAEMEDAVSTVPRFFKVPLEMLIGNRMVDGMRGHLSHLTAHFFGVYDGHGGSQVANYCRDRIHTALAEELSIELSNKNTENAQALWRRAFGNCFVKVDAEVGGQGNVKPVAPETVGSTAVVALVCSSHIIVANCGDSRAVLCRGKEPMALSVDHKPNREDEYQRIEAAGGKVIQWNGHRVFGVLAMSRSIVPRQALGVQYRSMKEL